MFEQPLFWISLLIIGAAAALIEHRRKQTLAWSVTLIGAAILYFFVGIPLWSLLALAVSGMAVAWSAARKVNPWLVFTPILAFWVIGKIGGAVPVSGAGWIIFTGYSFALVKIWTLLKDSAAGQVRDINPSTVLAYLFHFPTFIAGPMHYFGEFQDTLRRPRWPDAAGWIDQLLRILVGYLKVNYLAPLLRPASLVTLVDAPSASIFQLVVASIVYYVVLYLDFSGYCDLAIGATRVMGLNTPENFRHPYLAINIRDFWQRWHITFSRVLASYGFVPVSRALTRKTNLGRIPVMVTSYIITFSLCGFWHGSTPNYLLWGLYHAAGLIVLDVYQSLTKERRLRRVTRDVASWHTLAGRAAALVTTFLFVSVGWIPFVLPVDTMLRFAAYMVP